MSRQDAPAVPFDGAVAARATTAAQRRTDVVGRAVAAAESDTTPVAVILGAAGTGVGTAIAAVRARLAESGRRVVSVRLRPEDGDRPFGALYRMLAEAGLPAVAARAPQPLGTHASLLGAVAGLGDADRVACRDAAVASVRSAIGALLQGNGPVTVLVEGAQWADGATVEIADHLARHAAAIGTTFVFGVAVNREVDERNVGLLDGLVADGLAERMVLRPLTRAQAAALVEDATQARPQPEVVDRLHRLSAGHGGVLAAAVRLYHERGVLRVIDRYAHLDRGATAPVLDAAHSMLDPAREGCPQRWEVATAMAALCPLGTAAPELVASWLDIPVTAVCAEIHSLTRARILRKTTHGWRYRIPAARDAAREALGPYARRRIAALAVRAVWDGTATPDETHYLAEQLTSAGTFVDTRRSAYELLARGLEILTTDGDRATRWLSAATRLMDEPRERAVALVMASSAWTFHDRMSEGARYSREALRDHRDSVPPEMLQTLEIMYVTALAATAEGTDELTGFLDLDQPPADVTATALVTRGYGLIALDKWREGYRLLSGTRSTWQRAGATTADFGDIFLAGAAIAIGETTYFRRFLERRENWRTQDVSHRIEFTRHEISLLLSLGDLTGAQEVLRRNEIPDDQLREADLAVLAHLRGDWDRALELTRQAIADNAHLTRISTPIMMVKAGMTMLSSAGWINRGERLGAESARYPLSYCVGDTEAMLHWVVGEHEQARDLLLDRLGAAEKSGLSLYTEQLWGSLARLHLVLGDPAAAAHAVARLADLARRYGTGRARLEHLRACAEVHGDRAAGAEAVALARARGIPFERAWTLARIGVLDADEAILREAYADLDALGALLWRARLRSLMRGLRIPIPDRGGAKTEDDRLLAILIAEGLRNRQLAAVFGVSAKTIEARVTRLFARGGYRSRVALTAAVLAGEFEA